MMGGIDTDITGATALPGFYAAGECACVSINGANRLGSNSLTELLVFGNRAGKAAAQFALESPRLNTASLELQAAEEQERISRNFFRKEGGTERISTLRKEMNETMETSAGIYRSEKSLKETCNKIKELKDRFSNIIMEDKSFSFNTELTSALELEFMLDVAEAISYSALERTESRGSHQRTDFPGRDDENFLKHSLAYQNDIEPRIDYKDVVITKWPPGERVYGKEE
jgi:fumarate reductase flavoprotein subunit